MTFLIPRKAVTRYSTVLPSATSSEDQIPLAAQEDESAARYATVASGHTGAKCPISALHGVFLLLDNRNGQANSLDLTERTNPQEVFRPIQKIMAMCERKEIISSMFDRAKRHQEHSKYQVFKSISSTSVLATPKAKKSGTARV